MPYQFSFEKLNVWKDSKELLKVIYSITKHFPEEEKFGLTSQLRRVSISVSSNLAEGTSRKTNKDKAHFTTMAFGYSIGFKEGRREGVVRGKAIGRHAANAVRK